MLICARCGKIIMDRGAPVHYGSCPDCIDKLSNADIKKIDATRLTGGSKGK